MKTLFLLCVFAAALALPTFASDGPCVDGIMQCSDGTWVTCWIGCGSSSPVSESMKLKVLADQIAERLARYQTKIVTRKHILSADGQDTNCPGSPGCPGYCDGPNADASICQTGTPPCPPTDYMGNPNPPCMVIGIRGDEPK